MTHPGSLPGDPAGQPPEGYPYPPPATHPPPPPYGGYDGWYAPHGAPAYPPQPAINGMAVGSLVGSLVGVPSYFLCLPFIGSIVGVVLGVVALSQIGSRHQRGRGMAVAGIAIGAVSLAGALILLVFHSSTFFWY